MDRMQIARKLYFLIARNPIVQSYKFVFGYKTNKQKTYWMFEPATAK